jgi:hypothetical protein
VADAEQPTPKGRRPFHVAFPPGYFEMTDEEKRDAAGEMAKEIHRQLGIGR